MFKLSKIALSKIKNFEFSAKVKDNVITIELNFTLELRNKTIVKQGQNFVRDALDSKVNDSEILCSV